MAAIFISYAREDRDRAEFVARRLSEHGWSVWWDRQIAGGTQFDRVTEQAIAEAKIVIVLWSRHSVDSDWVRAEASFALEKKKLLPVRIDPVSTPLRFNLVQTLDLDGAAQNAIRLGGFERLIDEVARQLNMPTGRGQVPSAVDDVTSRIVKGGPKIASRPASVKPQTPLRAATVSPPPTSVSWTQTWRLPIVALSVVAIFLMFGFGYMMMTSDAPAAPSVLNLIHPPAQIVSRPQGPTSQIILPPAPSELPPTLVQHH